MKTIRYHLNTGAIIACPYPVDTARQAMKNLTDLFRGHPDAVITVHDGDILHTIIRAKDIVAVTMDTK